MAHAGVDPPVLVDVSLQLVEPLPSDALDSIEKRALHHLVLHIVEWR
ncbi:MAG TPA: hypothetical protein VEK07_24045 [Polyangiaceae bacterium]|nr:hypothetical protein [Polyangiaceae bacterium]